MDIFISLLKAEQIQSEQYEKGNFFNIYPSRGRDGGFYLLPCQVSSFHKGLQPFRTPDTRPFWEELFRQSI